MAEKTSLDATFFAFRKREKGGVLLGASIAFAVGMVVLVGLFAAAMWSTLGPVFTWYGEVLGATAKGNPGAMASLPLPSGLFLIGPAYLLLLVFVFILYAAYEAACLRWMIRGETGGLFGLALNADTWRVYATYWVWFLFVIGAYLGMIVAAIIAGLIGAAANNGALAGVLVVLACLAYLIAWLCVAVRLAPAAATSIGRGQFSFLKAWDVTRGRFWAILGSFLLLALIWLVVGIVISGVFFSVLMGAAFAGVDVASMAQNPDALVQAYIGAITQMLSNPISIALYALFQIISGAIALTFYTLFFGVNARAVEAALAEGKIQASA